jgi:hypothetical protein
MKIRAIMNVMKTKRTINIIMQVVSLAEKFKAVSRDAADFNAAIFVSNFTDPSATTWKFRCSITHDFVLLQETFKLETAIL